MATRDIRWLQRFANYNKALGQLKKFIVKGDLTELEQQGLIQAFEYTFELAWNVIKDYYEYQGVTDIQGSRDAFRLAYNRGLIRNGETWMGMIESRGKTSHTYNEEIADEIAQATVDSYYGLFVELQKKLETIQGETQ